MESRLSPRAAGTDRRHQYVGQWLVLDRTQQLWAIGDDAIRGLSARSAVDMTARHIVLPEVPPAISIGVARSGHSNHHGHAFDWHIVPLVGPVSGETLAVAACYTQRHTPPPPMPIMGTWEAHIPEPSPSARPRTYWSPDMHRVYDSDPSLTEHPEWWEAAQWLDDLILDVDRAELRRALDTVLAPEATDRQFTHVYRVRSQRSGHVHRVRSIGRRDDSPDGDAGRWIRGFCTRIESRVDDQREPTTADILTAALVLSPDPMCAIDTAYGHIWLTSPGFAQRLGIDLPEDRALEHMCHPDDLTTLWTFLADAHSLAGAASGPALVRLRAPNESWRQILITGTGISPGGTSNRRALCRLTPHRPSEE